MGHAQIGLLLGFNSKFPTSIPARFIWESPPDMIAVIVINIVDVLLTFFSVAVVVVVA